MRRKKQIQAMQQELALLRQTVDSGKELAAGAIHAASSRAEGPFVSINCAAIPKELFESEVFGYAPGAFSGARKEGSVGKIEVAHQGTLFLDEVGDLPLQAQAKLLRVLEEKRLFRLGSSQPRDVDFRLVAATNRDLEAMITAGTFREDLYYRINSMKLRLPSLRERREDIPLLVRFFLDHMGAGETVCTEEAMHALMAYSWPGNIRELENLVQGLAVTSKDSVIRASDVPISGVAKPAASARRDGLDFELDGKTYKEIMKDLENKVLSAAMERYGSITEVARHFQVDRSTIFRKVKELEKEGKMR